MTKKAAAAVAFIIIAILGCVLLVKYYYNDEEEKKPNSAVGTYQIGKHDTENTKYLSLKEDGTFIIYTADEKTLDKGIIEKTSKTAYAITGKQGKRIIVIGTENVFIDKNQNIKVLKKLSDTPSTQ